MVNQLRAEPTMFTVDPTENTEIVAGSKPGDVAIYLSGGTPTVAVFE
jgi:hypothetical protein